MSTYGGNHRVVNVEKAVSLAKPQNLYKIPRPKSLGPVRPPDPFGFNKVKLGKPQKMGVRDPFGKGVIRPIARVTGAAGRHGRRIVTGDPENKLRVIGKGTYSIPALNSGGRRALTQAAQSADHAMRVKVETGARALRLNKPRVGAVQKFSMGGIRTGLKALQHPKELLGGIRHGMKAGNAELRGAASRLPFSHVNPGTRVGQSIGGSIGLNPGRAGLAAGGVGGVAGAKLLSSKKPATPVAPPSPYGDFSPYGKRYYDPENERRYRAGAASAATGIGGAYLLHQGQKEVRRDSRGLSALRNMDEERTNHGAKEPDYAGLTPDQKAKKERDFARRAADAGDKNKRGIKINAARSAVGGRSVILRPRSAGKLGGGLALVGASGALLRNRNEERWD